MGNSMVKTKMYNFLGVKMVVSIYYIISFVCGAVICFFKNSEIINNQINDVIHLS